MTNGQVASEQEALIPKGLVHRGWTIYWNFIRRRLEEKNILRYGTVFGQEAPIRAMLRDDYITLNNSLVSILIAIEDRWDKMQDYLWSDIYTVKPASLIEFYKQLEFFDDPAVVDLFIEQFTRGSEFSYDSKKGFNLGSVEVKWNDDNEQYMYIFGYGNVERVKKEWDARSELYERQLVKHGLDAHVRPTLKNVRDAVIDYLSTEYTREFEFTKKLLKIQETYGKIKDEIIAFRTNLADFCQQYVRFRHTYMVIKPFVLIDTEDYDLVIEEDASQPVGFKDEVKTVKRKMPIYFDPADRRYEEELKRIEREIADRGGETAINAQMTKLWDDIIKAISTKQRAETRSQQISAKFDNLKAEIIKLIRGIAREKLLRETDADRSILERGIDEFLDELKKRDPINIPRSKLELEQVIRGYIRTIGADSDTIENTVSSVKELFDKTITLGNLVDFKRIQIYFDTVDITLMNLRTNWTELRRLLLNKIKYTNYVDKLKPKHPNFFKRDNEVEFGTDENGYPLEIDEDGRVLLDLWWNEIGENEWQIETIAKKPGGPEVLKKELDLGVTVTTVAGKPHVEIHNSPKRVIRYVDKRFAKTPEAYLDYLEMAVYIFNEIDAIRDDLRDGRYHKHSKTTTDYIIHAEKGIKIDPNTFKFTLEMLKEPINLRYDHYAKSSRHGYVLARPSYFNEGVPQEELEVTRTYRMKEYDKATNSLIMGEEEERKPTPLNPAFDRRALHTEKKFLHWGRMLYYEAFEGVNKWSENPYPHITTRGIAKYITYWIAVRTQNINEAIDAAENPVGYDIGIRRPLVGGPFVKNPFRDFFSPPV